MYSSTEAGSGGFILSGPTIVGKMNHGEAIVIEGIHGYSAIFDFYEQVNIAIRKCNFKVLTSAE